MLVIDEPTANDNPLPTGTFVVIAIDPAASVKLLDDEAKRVAAKITPTRCLALVDGDLNFEYIAGMQQLNRIYLLAGKGLPAHPESWAAVPIAPAGPHPETNRQHVQTDSPLGWSDCYLYTLCGITGLVSRIHQHDVVGPSLPEEEYDKVALAVMEDDERYGLEERARALGLATNPFPSVPAQEDDGISGDDQEDSTFLPREDEEHEIPPREDDDRLLPADSDNEWVNEEIPRLGELHPPLETFKDIADWHLADIFPKPKEPVTPQLQVSYEVWVNTSTLDSLGDPEQLIAEMNRLKEIEWEWAHRVVAAEQANQPATETWLANLGDAEAPSSDIDSIPTFNAELDSLIMPEDAIDNRDSADILFNHCAESEIHNTLPELHYDSAAIDSPRSTGAHSSRGKLLAPGSPGSYITEELQSQCSTSTCSSLYDSPAPSSAHCTHPNLIQRN